MKRGLSTGKPTKAEACRIEICKSGPCMACLVLVDRGELSPWMAQGPSDYHHLLGGSRRRGHRYGVGLCGWHHRGLVDFGCSHAEMRETYGPSLMDGSKLFHAEFGSDEELLARQDSLIGWKERDAA